MTTHVALGYDGRDGILMLILRYKMWLCDGWLYNLVADLLLVCGRRSDVDCG